MITAAVAGSAGSVLYDSSQTEPPLAVSDTVTGRFDYPVHSGETYLLKISGSAAEAALTIANLVATQGTEIQVFGTENADTFQFAPTGSYVITINGLEYHFDDTQFQTIVFAGSEGDDTAALTGGPDTEIARLFPDHGTFSGNGFLVTITDVVGITAHGGGGPDEAYLYDSPGADTFVSRKGYGNLSGEGYALETFDFMFNYGYAMTEDGGSDFASMEDTPGADKFKLDWSSPDQFFGKMYGGGVYYNRAKNFELIEAVMTDGNDTVRLYDSEGDETFYGQRDESRLVGNGFDVTVSGYDTLTAFASNGLRRRLPRRLGRRRLPACSPPQGEHVGWRRRQPDLPDRCPQVRPVPYRGASTVDSTGPSSTTRPWPTTCMPRAVPPVSPGTTASWIPSMKSWPSNGSGSTGPITRATIHSPNRTPSNSIWSMMR